MGACTSACLRIQEAFNEKEVRQQLEYILSDDGQKKMKRDYQELRIALGGEGASEKTAKLIIDAIQ